MDILPFSEDALKKAINILRNGGVIAHATETCYGLACDLQNKEAVQQLFDIKKRAHDKPVSALCESVEQAMQYVEWTEQAEKLATEYLPGPLTLILKMKETEGSYPLHPTPYPLAHTLGIRISSHPHAQALIKAFGTPLSTTSANVSSLPSPYSVQEIEDQFKNEALKPDLILDSGKLPNNPPSTVIDLSGTNNTIRQGGIQIGI